MTPNTAPHLAYDKDAQQQQTLRTFAEATEVVWDHYDADKGRLTVAAGGQKLVFTIPLEKAQQIAPRKESLALLADVSLESRSNAYLVDRVTGDRFESFGIKVNPKDRLTYVWIEPGRFTMGCSPGDGECDLDEKPAHHVTIARGFWMGQTDVTQEAYQRVTGKNPSIPQGAKLPVEHVTWTDSDNYCRATGMRLPTEAEWEYAGRAGSAASRYGDLDSIAWYDKNSGYETHPVMQKLPNDWGLYDMLGNVWQWTADWDADRYSGNDETDPKGPTRGQYRVVRGSSFSESSMPSRTSRSLSKARYSS